MRNIDWHIITAKNYKEVFAKLQESNQAVVLIGLTSTGYEHISMNLSDVRAFLQQQQSIIKAYQQYYSEAEAALEEANKEIKKANRDKD